MTASILLVEDDTTARELLRNVLQRAGYLVTTAASGEQAIALLHQAANRVERGEETSDGPGNSSYDVVLTDIRMEGKDGVAVMHEAAKLEFPPMVILMTGYGSIETALAALRANAYDYLLKPCDTGELLQRVASAIERRNAELQRADAVRMLTYYVEQLQATHPGGSRFPPRPTTPAESAAGGSGRGSGSAHLIRVGSLCLDEFRHAVLFHDCPLPITPIEYKLLQCLARNPGRVLRYQEIVEYTHEYRVSNSEAQVLLRAHVHNLRQKIDPAYLVNVRGVGYMLVVPPEDSEEQDAVEKREKV